MSKKKQVDPIPEEFASYEEAAEFWDTHDTMDYPGAFRPITAETKLRRPYFQIAIDADVVKVLQTQARKQGVSVSQLASEFLRQKLAS
jgi:hypothetical protein